ncbi:MAG: ubiquinone-dependent pyruvate dehydrogenase, partial [Nitrososphaerota archaeon]|nr:ubiquinone-dependent pyruvate dehydrogenase [Nitrososphaerota archaeon]
EIGSTYFQETHPELIFKECSAYCELVSHPEQIPRVLEIAIRTALSEGGVSVVVLPGDVSLKEAASVRTPSKIISSMSTTVPSIDEIKSASEVLNASPKITILGGAGCEGAHKELIETAEILQAPIVHAMRGKEFIEYDNPYDVGMTGLLGFSSGYYAMNDSDVLLMLGTDFPYQQFYPASAKIIQVDIRGQQIGRRTKVDLGLVGDVKETLRLLKPHLNRKTDSGHLKASLEHYRKTRAELDSQAVGNAGKIPIHPQYLAKLVSELAREDAIFTCDVGTPTLWAARYLKMNGQRRLVGSFSHGSMAGALPQAIGSQESFPDRQVVSLSGDGGLSMLMGDLLSLHKHELPVKVVVFNNSALAFVELEMKAAGILEYGTDLGNQNYAKIADAIGILGIRVERPEELRSALTRAFEYKGPALVDVVVNRQEILVPPSISFEELSGFTLYMVRAVLNGRADEVVDLAKTNLFR